MRRLLVVAVASILAAFAACGDDAAHHTIDAPIDSPAGSARLSAQLDPSPPDHKLELGVVMLSLAVVVSPITLRRRAA